MYACLFIPDYKGQSKLELRRFAASISPGVQYPSEDLAVLNMRGMRKLAGSPEQMGQSIYRRACAAGLSVHVGISQDPQTAVCAARGYAGVTVIAPGEEQRVLGELPVDLITNNPQTLNTLQSWGIRTFRQLAALPEMGIAERLGAEGTRLRNLARGAGARPMVPDVEKPEFKVSISLEHPVALMEPLSFILGRLLNTLCKKLGYYALSADEVELILKLDNREYFRRGLSLPFPTRDAATLLKLLQCDLNAHPPHAAVAEVELKAHAAPARVIQGGLFIPVAPQPEKLEITMARIAAVVGADRLGSPELIDTHRPGAFRMNRFDVTAKSQSVPRKEGECHIAVRKFRPPLRATVEAMDGHPRRLTARGIAGRVVQYAGPWTTSGDWWSGNPWSREEWDVSLLDGGLYRIYVENGWFVDGSYD